MKVLSLYDGMSCGMLAFNSAGIPVDRYVAYEIDKYAVPCESKQSHIYTVKDGRITFKDKSYPIKLKDGQYIIRKLTVDECKRLQTVPDSYDMSCISDTQAYRCLGNGWTVEVIAHLIKGAMAGRTKVGTVQKTLFD